jgi:hypothetical protein
MMMPTTIDCIRLCADCCLERLRLRRRLLLLVGSSTITPFPSKIWQITTLFILLPSLAAKTIRIIKRRSAPGSMNAEKAKNNRRNNYQQHNVQWLNLRNFTIFGFIVSAPG